MKQSSPITLAILALFGFLFYFFSPSETPHRSEFPSSAPSSPLSALISRDPLETLQKAQSHFKNSHAFTLQSCAADLQWAEQATLELSPESFDLQQLQRDIIPLTRATYELRQTLRLRLREWSQNHQDLKPNHPCINGLRTGLRILRYFEDYLILSALNPNPFNPEKDPVSGPLFQGQAPQLLLTENQELKIRSGDLILSRGNAYTSAAISRVGEEEAQFSHLSQIYIDAPVGTELSVVDALKDPRVHTIEAHIEIGSFTRTLGQYFKDGVARALLFRYRGKPDDAHRAATSIFKYVRGYQKDRMNERWVKRQNVNDNPPYDFKMDGKNHDEIFCAEIISMAYSTIGLNLPTFPTRLKKNELTQRMGIQAEFAFSPADIELDPHFEQIGEWRDLRKIDSILRKDVALSSIFDWMERLKYTFHSTSGDNVKAMIAWTARQLDMGFSERLPKNMDRGLIRMIFSLDRAGEILEKQLVQLEKIQKENGREFRPVYWEQMIALEGYRKRDSERYIATQKRPRGETLHSGFRPQPANADDKTSVLTKSSHPSGAPSESPH